MVSRSERFSRPCVRLTLTLVLVGLSVPAPAAETSRRLTVRGNGTDLGETPIVIEVASPLEPGNYRLRAEQGGSDLAGTVFRDAGKTFLGVVLPGLKAKQAEAFTLERRADSTGEREAGVQLKEDGDNIRITVRGEPFTTYRKAEGPKPYFWPVIGPTGKPYTRAYPMESVEGEDRDHPHQRSFWFTHGSVNGMDFWSEQGEHGSIRETGRQTVASGAAVGVLRTTDSWIGPHGQKVCDDERVLRVYATREARVLDFEVTLRANSGPVTFGDTKEGMFGLRVASTMDVKRQQGGKITNAEGITDGAAWGKASPWVDYTGPVEGETVGIAILNHPESFRYPTTWHVRDYGLFAANPFGWHDFGRPMRGNFTLPEGDSMTFRYRVVLHKGGTASAGLPAAHQGYARPPEVRLSGD